VIVDPAWEHLAKGAEVTKNASQGNKEFGDVGENKDNCTRSCGLCGCKKKLGQSGEIIRSHLGKCQRTTTEGTDCKMKIAAPASL